VREAADNSGFGSGAVLCRATGDRAGIVEVLGVVSQRKSFQMPGRIEMGFKPRVPSPLDKPVQTVEFECDTCKKKFHSTSRNKGKRYCGDCRVKKF